MAAEVNEQLLDDRLAELEKARAWSPRLVSKLESHIRSADEEGLFRVNPFTFAREKNLNETESIDLFLYAPPLASSKWTGSYSASNAPALSRASAALRACIVSSIATSAKSTTRQRWTTISPSPSQLAIRFAT